MAGEQFSLVWNSFPVNLSTGLYSLLTDEHLVDVTLAAEGKILRAHKLILSVCSTFFRDLFKGNTCKHPIVILKDVSYQDLFAMLQFMYQGEVNIKQEDIESFLKVAETLQIKGLTKDKAENKETVEETCLEGVEPVKTEVDLDSELSVDCANEIDRFPEEKLLQRDNSQAEVVASSSVIFHHKTIKSDPSTADSPCTETYDDYQRPASAGPLDFTADNHQIPSNADKFRDFGLPDGSSTSTQVDLEGLKIESTTPMAEDEPADYQTEKTDGVPGIISHPELTNDSLCQVKAAKGRRTVKGIPHSALPLETTLRVVSELGPTLRVERGKVVRMYSCPWCLRHFTRKENLKLHVRYIHGPLESLTCKLCGNKYKNSNSLRVHSYLYHNTKRNKHAKMPLVTSNG